MAKMTHLSQIITQQRAEYKRGIGYEDPAGAVWTCPTCGESPPPKYLQVLNRHIQGDCQCQRTARQRLKKAERERLERAVRLESIRTTYGWLGRLFSSEEMAAYTFDTFEAHEQPKAFTIVEQWIENPSGVLLLHGTYGTGKSHLMAAICNELRDRGRKCRWCSAPKLFQAMAEAMNRPRLIDGVAQESWVEIARKAANAELFFLDDVDKLKEDSQWHEEVYHSIFDDRVNAGRPSVISINKLNKLAHCMGESVADRLYIGRITVPFMGESYRKRFVIRGA